ncbi:MAG: hypothetical protein IJB24_03070, partial [Clostridia bacterium]|nr:hypothetical protein [Clostridia bacterium]
YDDEGLYYAADITDSGFVPATGYDDIDNNGTTRNYGFNGDVFTLMIDPLGLFEQKTYLSTVWYNVALFEDGTARMYRSKANEGEITTGAVVRGAKTLGGWTFEAFIPWDVIVYDVETLTSSKLSPALEEVVKSGAVNRASVMYVERYKEIDKTLTHGRYLTVCETAYDGTSFTKGLVQGMPKYFGLNLVNGEAEEHSWSEWTVVEDATCYADGSRTRTCLDCSVTETKVIYSAGHQWSDWYVEKPATTSADGLRYRECSVCSTREEEAIPMITEEPIIVVYYNATVYTANKDFSNIDVVNYHPATLDYASHESVDCPITHRSSSSFASFASIARSQNPDIKLLFTVANNNLTVFESWLVSDAAAQRLADHVVEIVKNYDYDGFDVDYEFPTEQYRQSKMFVKFMQYVRDGFDELSLTTGKEYYLSMAIPGTQWAFSLFDLNALQDVVDYFNIMDYDLHVGSSGAGLTHHHTPPYDNPTNLFSPGSVASDIELFLSNGIRADKIVPGCGLYARRWTGVEAGDNPDLPGLYQPGTLDNTSNSAYLYYATSTRESLLNNYINKNGYVEYWDDEAKAPYLYSAKDKVFLTYDNEKSVEYKCNIIAAAGVRGAMVFDYVTCDGIDLFASMRNWFDMTNHTCTYVVDHIEEPGCETEGATVYTCEKCNQKYSTPIAAKGHEKVESYIVAPTCTTNGMIKTVCKNCGKKYNNTMAPATGHAWGDWAETKAPTATENGEETRTCATCGATETQAIPALGQEDPYTIITLPGTWNGWTCETTEMTEVSDGIWKYTFDALEAGNHSFKFADSITGWSFSLGGTFAEFDAETDAITVGSDISFTLASESVVTIVLDMTAYDVATGTGAKFTVSATANECSHAWGEWEVVAEADCMFAGLKTRTCGKCGEVEEEEVAPLAHSLTEVAEKAASCYEDGNVAYRYCSVCGYHETLDGMPTNRFNVIVPAAHSDVVYVEAIEAKCHYTGNVEHWVCNACETVALDADFTQISNRKNVVIPRLLETADKVEAKEATCLELGNVEYWHCDECDQYWADEALTQLTNRLNVIIGTLDHEIVEVEAIEPACHYTGNVAYKYCTVCDTHWTMDGRLTNRKDVILPRISDEATHVEAVEATCYNEGNIEYWYCEECGQFWADAALTQITNALSVKLGMTEHDVTAVEEVAAGCHYEGNTAYWYCNNCDTVWADEELTQITNRKNV